MPIAPTYPGVYVQGVASGVRTIVGVSTSTALFIGASQDGPMNFPCCASVIPSSRGHSPKTPRNPTSRDT